MKGCQLTVCLWKTRFYPPFCPFLPFCCFNDLSVVVMCWSKSQNHNKDRNSDISSSNKRITFHHLKNQKTWIECEKKSDALNLVKWWWCLVDYSFSLWFRFQLGICKLDKMFDIVSMVTAIWASFCGGLLAVLLRAICTGSTPEGSMWNFSLQNKLSENIQSVYLNLWAVTQDMWVNGEKKNK